MSSISKKSKEKRKKKKRKKKKRKKKKKRRMKRRKKRIEHTYIMDPNEGAATNLSLIRDYRCF